MKNPYEAELAEDRVLPGQRALIVFASVFVLCLLVPVAFRAIEREGFSAITGETLKARLVSVEKSIERQNLFERWRRNDQELFYRAFKKGNRRVVVGRDGWLYYRPDLEAVYGKGPRYVEPNSVAREAVDDSWQPPIPLIIEFARQLEERGIELTLVPVPTKAMLASEKLTDDKGGRISPEYESIQEELRSAGVKVFDPISELYGNPEIHRFLKQDTHWKTRAMSLFAKKIEEHLEDDVDQQRSKVEFQIEKAERSSLGDLVGMLDVGGSSKLFSPESQMLQKVIDQKTGEPLASDADSEIVLLGDSFVNIYDDPALGFGVEGEKSIGAGFASHLAIALGRPIHTIAINGGGSTAVRRSFAALPDNVVRSKRKVIWVFSARDLLLAELPARRAGIEWRPVEFNQESSPEMEAASSLVVTATLSERSPVGDPKQTPYESAVYSAIFTEIEGDYEKEELFAFLWSFEKRVLKPTANLKSGGRYRLHLVPFEDAVEAGRATQIDDFFRNDLDRWFVEKAEPIP